MMMMNTRIEIEVRTRFVKDNNLPIQIVETPYFEYFLDLYESDFGSRTLWNSFQKEIKDGFSGNSGGWLSHFYQVRDKIITNILENPEYIKFTQDSVLFSNITKDYPGEIKRNLYTGDNIGKTFMSVDLKKANFQALRWYSPGIVKGAETYEEFLGNYETSPSFLRSKYTRQVIFGKLNVSRQIQIEKYLIWTISELIKDLLPENFVLFSRMTDEIIYEIQGDYQATGELEEKIIREVKEKLDLSVRTEVFSLGWIQRFTRSGSSITGVIKDYAYPEGKTSELKNTSITYFAQIYKAWKGLTIDPVYDLAILHDKELAHFDYPLRYDNPKDNS